MRLFNLQQNNRKHYKVTESLRNNVNELLMQTIYDFVAEILLNQSNCFDFAHHQKIPSKDKQCLEFLILFFM